MGGGHVGYPRVGDRDGVVDCFTAEYDAVIVDAVRTPGGRRNGKLKDWHPADLAAHVLKAIEERNGLDPAMVDDVIMGCVMQVGEQSLNIGRNAVLAAGWPETVPATTVDRQCGSSQQALHFAAQGVMAGAYDIVVAAGVEVMTRTPMGASIVKDMGFPFPQDQGARWQPADMQVRLWQEEVWWLLGAGNMDLAQGKALAFAAHTRPGTREGDFFRRVGALPGEFD